MGRVKVENRCVVDRPPVVATVWPHAGEATVTWAPVRRPEPDQPDEPPGDCQPSLWADLDQDEQDRLNRERADRRARTTSRRYFAANRLRYQWVLTFAGGGVEATAEGRREVFAAMARFVRRLRHMLGPMPWWYSPEIHPNGHGWHVNFYVARRLEHGVIARIWAGCHPQAGHVWVSDKLKDPRVRGTGNLARALRLACAYAVKYATKDWARAVLDPGARRFAAAHDFKPLAVIVAVDHIEDGVELVATAFRSKPVVTWDSRQAEDWDGPPCVALMWDELHPPP